MRVGRSPCARGVAATFVASILDPHGHHLEDALMKLKALARFAGAYGEAFHRIEALTEVDGRMKVIDLKMAEVRQAALYAKDGAVDLYRSALAVDYVV